MIFFKNKKSDLFSYFHEHLDLIPNSSKEKRIITTKWNFFTYINGKNIIVSSALKAAKNCVRIKNFISKLLFNYFIKEGLVIIYF